MSSTRRALTRQSLFLLWLLLAATDVLTRLLALLRGRPIYYSICPHTMASQRGTAKNYSGTFPAVPPIYAPPVSWTASQRHQLANSLLVEYQNTVDAWYVPGVDKHGHG